MLVNDPAAAARLTELFNAGGTLTLDPGPVTGSEDVGLLATAAGVPWPETSAMNKPQQPLWSGKKS